ncbi:MAG TPA: FtsQ-type POTRA domain-containing protein [Paenibacillus sp.]|uniref:cell division protein FtsQ/DivIB n=1 Tax=Paenibacillus sp. TaxID=58172 RepID=UPI0028D1499E|nr:FtsQ-type POTRA domain-containing protein [Paenibacillus sp.]HUC93130.1 FtsQ-type POTRA domain-containing protein [Paenibacillus sp.]
MAESMPVLRQPKQGRKNSRKLLLILLLLFVALLGVLFFRSPISEISAISVSGQQYIAANDIRDASGIAEGDPFFFPGKGEIERRIAKLKPVEAVTVDKSFPGKIAITVKEYSAVAFELTEDGLITAILSNGATVGSGSNFVVDKPVLSGWKKDDPNKAELTRVLSSVPDELLSDFSEIIPYPSKSYKDRIKIYTRTKFEIVTAVSLLQEKAETIQAVIETQEPGSVTTLLSDYYVPYAADDAAPESAE